MTRIRVTLMERRYMGNQWRRKSRRWSMRRV